MGRGCIGWAWCEQRGNVRLGGCGGAAGHAGQEGGAHRAAEQERAAVLGEWGAMARGVHAAVTTGAMTT
ncbi:hypothetical protein Ari01nite_34770 [Paractinoplanes rishiriensis]|uniref:Uncharacterized protein n=1 Tax=Paractinoplanes rishiriensis TaxID=1050105 RepID=A0A919JZ90_9ACTN|nr:hypothetical protein Ari01nite_34770 [Actinoplanes rishiriensis]